MREFTALQYAPDPNELVDFMTDEGCATGSVQVAEAHPVPLYEPEEGLLDEEILPLWKDWQRGPCVQPCG